MIPENQEEDKQLLKTDRRIFDRFNAPFPAKFKDSRYGTGIGIALHDVSAQGAKIITNSHLYCNDRVTLEINLPDGLNPLILTGGVVWSKSTEANNWDIGVKFDNIRFMHLARLYKFSENSTV